MPRQTDALLRVTDGTDAGTVDLLAPGSGLRLADPGWRPNIAQYKGGGYYADSALAEGRGLVYSKYGNVIETIPLTVRGRDQAAAIGTIRDLLRLLRQAGDYWKEGYEYNDVWLEARPACNDCFTGYTRIIQGNVDSLSDPFRQPFYTSIMRHTTMEDITLIIERQPFWRATALSSIIGTLYNYLRNPDFELWTQEPGAVADVEPDNWDNLETLWITGTNNREDTAVHSGEYCLRTEVRGSTAAGAFKGVSQIVSGLADDTQYTVLAWVRSAGVSNGVGRVLVTYADQFELYRSASRHGWTLYARAFTKGSGDTVAVHCEILTTAANADGTVWFDSLMFLPGDWVQEATDGVLPYMSSSHIKNHWDQPGGAVVAAGDIDWIDVWDVPGDVDALVRLEMTNNTTVADPADEVEVIAEARIGQRRTRNVLRLENYYDPAGIADADCSSGDRMTTPGLTGDWQTVATYTIDSSDITAHNFGRYRLFVRVYDSADPGPTLELRVLYWIGVAGINVNYLDSISVPINLNWCIVDLTPRHAINWTPRKGFDVPGSLGISIQMRRTTGSAAGRLDYALLMPTDGGICLAEIDPPVTNGNALILDRTGSESIQATSRRAGWLESYNIPDIGVVSLEEYRGDLYAGGYFRIARRRAGVWSVVRTLAVQAWTKAMEVYDGMLYYTEHVDLLKSDGGSFGTAVDTLPQSIYSLRAFNGKLYIGIGNAGGGGDIYEYDASTDATALVYNTGDDFVEALEVYNNRLYAVTRDSAAPKCTNAGLYQYDVDTGWSQVATPGGWSLKTFKGRLFMGSCSGEIYAWDGETLTRVHTDTELIFIMALESLGEKLYASGHSTLATDAAHVLGSTDGDTWAVLYDTTAQNFRCAKAYQGAIWMGEYTGTGDSGVYMLSEEDNQYEVPDYQGGPFTCPNRDPGNPRRHRYFFSWDRRANINNLDDEILAGIGFVPRYFSLRGRG